VEVKSLREWGLPFEIFGRNSLASYLLSELFYGLQEFTRVRMADGSHGDLKLWICAKAFGWLGPPIASLTYTVCYLALFLGLMDIFYRRKIFVKI
jgi:predicted acyltransferase